jgi:glycosyltransferase involved in cell wall biosynthesis
MSLHSGSRSAQVNSEPLRILHVVPSLSPRVGGPSKAAREMCEALSRHGLDVTLFTTDLAVPVQRRWVTAPERLAVPLKRGRVEAGVDVWHFAVTWPWAYAYSRDLYRELARRIRDFDLVHIHSIYLFPTWAASRLARANGIPYLVRPHGTLDPVLQRRRRLRKAVYKQVVGQRTLQRAAGIHYTSPQERDQAQALGYDAPAFVVPLGLDATEFATLPDRGSFQRRHPQLRDQRLVVFMGRITPKKGLDLLIDAFSLAVRNSPDITLVIAGPDDEGYGKTVRRLVVEAGLRARTFFVGMVSGHEKLELLASADVWVLPSYGENFAFAAVEALACGVPVVITNRVNIHSQVTAANAGLVTECDAGQLCEAIRRILTDPELSRRVSRNGPALIQNQFSWDARASELIDVYRNVVDGYHISSSSYANR